ncbi:MAG: glycosyltransferase, partial [Pseudomonadota bacterium]
SAVVDAVEPDVAHIHCVQDIGAGLISELSQRNIPIAVTVHDCWWICERQFMINTDQKYCHQTKIDLSVCRFCVPDIAFTRRRNDYLRRQLNACELVLFPSDFQRDLFVANDFAADRCRVNKNGVAMPAASFERTERPDATKVRFGFVGGPGPIKGAPQIVKAFRDIKRTDYELQVVDAARHIGHSWTDSGGWQIPGPVRFMPPYNAETMDDFFAGVDVLLFPSQWKESFGLTVREAMARGIWVIASDAGGLSQDCIDGVNARLIPMTADHEPLRAAIEETFEMDLHAVARCDHIVSRDGQAAELDAYLRGLLTTSTAAVSASRAVA